MGSRAAAEQPTEMSGAEWDSSESTGPLCYSRQAAFLLLSKDNRHRQLETLYDTLEI